MAFDLSSIKRGVALAPPRLVVYGVGGIGKTTFAGGAPKPIFIETEEGSGNYGFARFPLARAASDVMAAVTSLYNEKHEFETVVLDSADWLESMIQAEVEKGHDAKDLAYGKDAIMVANRWREFLDGLNALRNERSMAVVLIAHTEIKRFDSPETEPYDRYQPKLSKRANELVVEWADAVLFANYRTVIRKEDVGFKKTVARGITTGERLLHTTETPAYKAKNRYGLPPTLPLSWAALSEAIAAGANSAEAKQQATA